MNILKNIWQKKELDLTATLNGEEAYAKADFVVVATPTQL